MRPYHKLKCRMYEKEITQLGMANEMNVSQTFLSRRMTGNAQWELDTVYKVCDILEIPYTEIAIYWPK